MTFIRLLVILAISGFAATPSLAQYDPGASLDLGTGMGNIAIGQSILQGTRNLGKQTDKDGPPPDRDSREDGETQGGRGIDPEPQMVRNGGVSTAFPVGSHERRALLDAARHAVTEKLGKPVKFLVPHLDAREGWAFLDARMQDDAGKPVNYTGTPYAEAAAHGVKSDVYDALLKKDGDAWRVVEQSIGPTDHPVWGEWAGRHGVPTTIFPVSADYDLRPGPEGQRYSGTVSVEITSPGGEFLSTSQGKANMRLTTDDAGKLKLALTGSLDRKDDAGFEVELDPDGRGGYVTSDERSKFTIDPQGNIEGWERSAGQSLTFSGTLRPDALTLITKAELLSENKGGLKAGTVLTFTHSVKRQSNTAPVGARQAPQTETGRKCARIEWQTRLLPNLSGGPMNMIRVPVCVAQ